MRDTLPDLHLAPVVQAMVQAMKAMRGVQLVAAMTLVAERQDVLRFDNPRQLMAYVGLAPGLVRGLVRGLVPGEHSSGPKWRQGSIAKAGNSAARRMLVEVAWHDQHSARVSPIIAKRHDQLPKAVTDSAMPTTARCNERLGLARSCVRPHV